MVEIIKPGAYYYYAMHGGSDNYEKFSVYDTWDESTETGTLADLTGVTAKAEFRDDDGVSVFEATVTVDVPNSTIEIEPTATLCTTHADKDGNSWGVQFVWSTGLKTIEMYGGWEISKVVVD